ncbi:MAG: SMI1/KNR4 family protein [Fibrella sp.]|nr:SMI1/KNR4 family protein [Armatimonadota bacterium]
MPSDRTTETETQTVDRYADLKAFIAEWHRPIEPGDGNTEGEIAEAEARLRFRLPEALRELYALIGKRDDITSEHNRLLRLKDLTIAGSWMIIWEENQNVYVCAIKGSNIALPNPLAWVLTDGEVFPQDKPAPITQTALLMVAYETFLAGRFCGLGEVENEQELNALRRQAVSSPHPVLMQHEIFHLDTCLVCFAGKNAVWLAAKNAVDFDAAIEKWQQIKWSYTSLEDE